ncbi:hypothetical protein G5V57_18115 [Nordella sp. HKS 07]|uniref:hypothetical protein n=1 Tax=Nordella sp. HKS 07 TaxID=2712222 RepID=UPI0013E10211|nr:hypothetical protein [Nordella sp. HKS 07]QIG49462.1 hypothetical protein G5V57_18115 [Nordella sp. HKS 07]
MTAVTSYRKARRGRRMFNAIRDSRRGWLINWKALGVAYIVEVAIIGSSLAAGIQFANRYADDRPSSIVVAQIGGWNFSLSGHSEAWWIAVIATVAFCVAEAVRLPLVHGFRTANSWIMRGFLLLGILMACGITVKSMSQVAEQMFHPRLREVQKAATSLEIARAELSKVIAQRDNAQTAEGPFDEQIKSLDEQIKKLNDNLDTIGPPPPARKIVITVKVPIHNKRGKTTGYRKETRTKYVPVPWEGKAIVEQMEGLRGLREEAVTKRNAAGEKTAEFEQAVADQKAVVTTRERDHRDAVNDSQLHSFTAMVFGKDPTNVMDGEVHWFLRLFVFFPAIFVSVASSLLAMSAYEPVRKREEKINATLSIEEKDGTIAQHLRDLVHNEVHERRQRLATV